VKKINLEAVANGRSYTVRSFVFYDSTYYWLMKEFVME
jgi:hypothetical protein